jgi:hypothetical protein
MKPLTFIAKPNNPDLEYLVINSRGDVHCRFRYKDFNHDDDPILSAAHSAIFIAELLNLEAEKTHKKLYNNA